MLKKSFLCLLVLVISLNLRAQTLHALLFVNEKEENREVDRQADMKNMKIFFRDVASLLGYHYVVSTNSDKNFTAARVNQEIEKLKVGPKDVVVFYYSGHGHNAGNDKWPTLNLKDKDYWMSDILAKLNEKTGRAKTVLCIADCCNKGLDNAPLPVGAFNTASADNMKALFTNFTGRRTILCSASVQGQYSYSHTDYGALFGIAFRQAIHECTENAKTNPTWDQVFEKAKIHTVKASNNKQTPQYQVIIAANPFDDDDDDDHKD